MNYELDDLLAMSEMKTPNMKSLFETAYVRGIAEGYRIAKEKALEVIEKKL
jgi:hypothetical protein